jgi:hypothetical protein
MRFPMTIFRLVRCSGLLNHPPASPNTSECSRVERASPRVSKVHRYGSICIPRCTT